ncbi:sensor histidine kinase [Paenibacillus sp. HW567]|uniref:sensor histidine kinase n=1 Tax=Paenibacillus sp. HW567 TaxID=1034769 RepID=UPI00036B51DA|nr:HAMP domain-containing sensor histidine kinase [Paenibacillus sp. HW567]
MHRMKIRTKMMLWYSLFSILILAMLLPLVYSTVSNSLYQGLKSDLGLVISQMISVLEVDDGELTINTTMEMEGDASVCITDEANNIIYAKRNGDWMGKESVTGSQMVVTHNGIRWLIVKKHYFSNGIELTLYAGSSTSTLSASLGNLRLLLLALVPLYLCISALGAFFIAGHTLKPIAAITETARSIRAGDFSRRSNVIESKDEVGELSWAFNSMLDQVENSIQRERQFSSAASHELRTPIAVIIACVEDALNGEQTSGNLENLTAIQRETGRMNHIVSQLLILTRGYEGRYSVNREGIPLNDMVNSVMEELYNLAARSGVTLTNDIEKNITIYADQSLMTHFFVNVIENGIKYGKNGGAVNVAAKNSGGMTEIIISDDGIGINAEDLPHIFERFYRADKARDRTGVGLGLSIVKWIADTHDSEITVSSVEGKGTEFRILIQQGGA